MYNNFVHKYDVDIHLDEVFVGNYNQEFQIDKNIDVHSDGKLMFLALEFRTLYQQ